MDCFHCPSAVSVGMGGEEHRGSDLQCCVDAACFRCLGCQGLATSRWLGHLRARNRLHVCIRRMCESHCPLTATFKFKTGDSGGVGWCWLPTMREVQCRDAEKVGLAGLWAPHWPAPGRGASTAGGSACPGCRSRPIRARQAVDPCPASASLSQACSCCFSPHESMGSGEALGVLSSLPWFPHAGAAS